MKIIESISREMKKIKSIPQGKKLGYIYDYYKWHIFITVFLVVSVIATAISIANEKEIVLSGYLFDSYYDIEQDEPFVDFPSYAGLDTDKETVEFLANIQLYGMYAETSQQFYATVAAGHTDFAVFNPQSFLRFSYETFSYLYDLREILTPQQLEQLSDRLFYVDASMIDQLDRFEGTIRVPDHDKPETMKDPVPVGINIRGGRGVDAHYLGDEPVFISFVNNAPHMDMIMEFLRYLNIGLT